MLYTEILYKKIKSRVNHDAHQAADSVIPFGAMLSDSVTEILFDYLKPKLKNFKELDIYLTEEITLKKWIVCIFDETFMATLRIEFDGKADEEDGTMIPTAVFRFFTQPSDAIFDDNSDDLPIDYVEIRKKYDSNVCLATLKSIWKSTWNSFMSDWKIHSPISVIGIV